MVEEDPILPETEAADPEPGDSSQPSGRRFSTRSILGIGIAIALVAGAALWGISWLSGAGERTANEQRAALADSWKASQKKEATGVDFELKISDQSSATKPTLDFDHSGAVTASDSCFEATSKYIVLKDGSLAVEDLTGSKSIATSDHCAGSEPTELFQTSKISFGSKSWTAFGPDGKKLVGSLKEQRSIAAPEK